MPIMQVMHERIRTGLNSLETVTALLDRVRGAHPTAGSLEAADLQWWWRTPRSTDGIPSSSGLMTPVARKLQLWRQFGAMKLLSTRF